MPKQISKHKRAKTPPTPKQIVNAARILGRIGGPKGGKARAAKLSAEDRTRIASKAANTRWKNL